MARGPSGLAKITRDGFSQVTLPKSSTAASSHLLSRHAQTTDKTNGTSLVRVDQEAMEGNGTRQIRGTSHRATSRLVESIVSIQSLKENLVLPTLGFVTNGVTNPLNVCKGALRGNYKNCLKTASGFGGCNAAVLFSK